ncbi:Hypp8264 [Branchiostoma lanceolatum]|uniref:Hypp8264 protein n=1 Tax=Branchiostoma lanceolatum TaxID=7740 RepID=A0A8J9Z7N3_BRALA|nr:Hypp8264 [Branchiostoma lanceolatum]
MMALNLVQKEAVKFEQELQNNVKNLFKHGECFLRRGMEYIQKLNTLHLEKLASLKGSASAAQTWLEGAPQKLQDELRRYVAPDDMATFQTVDSNGFQTTQAEYRKRIRQDSSEERVAQDQRLDGSIILWQLRWVVSDLIKKLSKRGMVTKKVKRDEVH